MTTPEKVKEGLQRVVQELARAIEHADSLEAMQDILDKMGWPYGPTPTTGEEVYSRICRALGQTALVLAAKRLHDNTLSRSK